MRTFLLFNNQIEVSFEENLISEYENICGFLNEKYLEHLVYTGGLTSESDLSDIQKELHEALNEEIKIHIQVPEKIKTMIRKCSE